MAITNQIGVSVQTHFIREQSDPHQKHFAFGYAITISNLGKRAARLLRRHWIITDANGKVQEVQGEGVVGEQPLIHPGHFFRYSSYAVLPTPVGSMQGTYTFISDLGEYFDAVIFPFRLAMPELVN